MTTARFLRGFLVLDLTGIGTPLLLLAILLTPPLPAAAQDALEQGAPAHLNIVEGQVTLDRETESLAAEIGMPLVPGDRLRSSRGRAEVLFADGSALAVDEFTTIDIQSPLLLRVTTGRVRLTVARDARSQYQIDTPAATARIDGPGEFRLRVLGGTSGPQSELAVVRGRAQLHADGGWVMLNAGERSITGIDALPSRPEAFNSARGDAFEDWATIIREDRAGRSASYLPPELRVYGGTLDRDGTWDYESSYGYIWYPTVGADWRPYYNGAWADVPRYGWTWIGTERWAWPTHHYGRWGYGRNRWFWIPEHHWATAWVSWGAAPGYVSWCPLGVDNRPVFEWSGSIEVGWRGWSGWVVLPRTHFGIRGEQVRRYAVAPQSLAERTPFVRQAAPPIGRAQSPARRIAGGPQSSTAPAGQNSAASPPPSRDPGRGPRDRTRASGPPAASGASVAAARGPSAPALPGSVPRGGPSAGRGYTAAALPGSSAPALPGSSTPAASRGAVGTGRAVPRTVVPGRGAGPDTRPQNTPRQYPFGDFRRRTSPDNLPPGPVPDTVSVDAARGPRAAAVDRGAERSTAERPPVNIPPPTSAPYGGGALRAGDSGGGAIGHSRESANPGGGAIRTPERTSPPPGPPAAPDSSAGARGPSAGARGPSPAPRPSAASQGPPAGDARTQAPATGRAQPAAQAPAQAQPRR